MKENGTFETLSKRERLQVDRQRAKLEKDLGSVADMNRLPAALSSLISSVNTLL